MQTKYSLSLGCHIVSGFSPYQLVYGRNPSLPNVFCNDPPALENKTINNVMLEHLSAMQAARQAFTQAEYSDKISTRLMFLNDGNKS